MRLWKWRKARSSGTSEPPLPPAIASSDIVVTLLHGTWAGDRDWTRPGSVLRTRLSESLATAGFSSTFVEAVWSGRNRHSARLRGAARLQERLRNALNAAPGANHFLVCHSHGGNIAHYALAHGALRQQIAGVVTLGTPFLLARARALPRAFAWILGLGFAVVAFVVLFLWPHGRAIMELESARAERLARVDAIDEEYERERIRLNYEHWRESSEKKRAEIMEQLSRLKEEYSRSFDLPDLPPGWLLLEEDARFKRIYRVVSMIALGIGLCALMAALRLSRSSHIVRAMYTVPLGKPPFLVARSSGDEVAAGLQSARFLIWLGERIMRIAAGISSWMTTKASSQVFVMCSVLFWGVLFWSTWQEGPAEALRFVEDLVVIRTVDDVEALLIGSIALVAASVLLLAAGMAVFTLAAVSIAAIAFGGDSPRFVLAAETTVEATPLGQHETFLARSVPGGLAHTAIYENEEVLAAVGSWIRKKAGGST